MKENSERGHESVSGEGDRGEKCGSVNGNGLSVLLE